MVDGLVDWLGEVDGPGWVCWVVDWLGVVELLGVAVDSSVVPELLE